MLRPGSRREHMAASRSRASTDFSRRTSLSPRTAACQMQTNCSSAWSQLNGAVFNNDLGATISVSAHASWTRNSRHILAPPRATAGAPIVSAERRGRQIGTVVHVGVRIIGPGVAHRCWMAYFGTPHNHCIALDLGLGPDPFLVGPPYVQTLQLAPFRNTAPPPVA